MLPLLLRLRAKTRKMPQLDVPDVEAEEETAKVEDFKRKKKDKELEKKGTEEKKPVA